METGITPTISIRLTDGDLQVIDRIAEHFKRETGLTPNRSDAIKFGLIKGLDNLEKTLKKSHKKT